MCEEARRYGVGIQRILLFGSRVRGAARYSDGDFLLIVDQLASSSPSVVQNL